MVAYNYSRFKYKQFDDNYFSADSEPVSLSIQLEYVDGLTLNLTLGLGHPFRVRSTNIGERIIR